MKSIVYTSLETFRLKHQEVRHYTELDEDFVDWVNETSIKLLIGRNKAEFLAGQILKQYVSEVHEQVFFRIAGRSYFLDYYLPQYKIAIEIDGSYHKIRKIEDRERDINFRNIGVRTIRIKSMEVLRGNFINALKEQLTPKKKRKKII